MPSLRRAVADLMLQVGQEVISPRFRNLQEGEIEEKSPGETVTVADREAEAVLTPALTGLIPGSVVVGEEAVSERPALLEAIGTEPWVWLVDPLDGTSNFARGEPTWAIQVALVHNGETVSSWIWRYGDDNVFQAERGAGAYHGERVLRRMPAAPDLGALRGAVLTRFLTDDERVLIERGTPLFREVNEGFSCAGFEYPAIVNGEEDFALFQRTLPWDHAPGVLLLQEAGGYVAHTDGLPHQPAIAKRGLLLATDEATWKRVHRQLLVPGEDETVIPGHER